MGNGNGREWEHSQHESETEGMNIRKKPWQSIRFGEHHPITMDTFTACSAARNCWFDIMSKMASGHQAHVFRTEIEIIL